MNIQRDIPLKDFSNYKIGGPAKFFLEIEDIDDLKQDFSKFGKIFILGGGTNVLFGDEGFDGLVIFNKFKGIRREGNKLIAGAGELFSDVLDFATHENLSGLEWGGGLPGTIGGAVRGNAGAFGGEIKDSVVEVKSVDLRTGKSFNRTKNHCDFRYRSSIFKHYDNMYHHSEIVTSVTVELKPGKEEEIRKIVDEKIQYRKNRHPLEYPNIGSTFKNIPYEKLPEKLQIEFKQYIKTDPFPVIPTTKLLALASLKGKRVGNAQISEKHPNFIINLGNANATDVIDLIELAKKTVKDKWGITLEEEIQIVS